MRVRGVLSSEQPLPPQSGDDDGVGGDEGGSLVTRSTISSIANLLNCDNRRTQPKIVTDNRDRRSRQKIATEDGDTT